MLANILRTKVRLMERVSTNTAIGPIAVWKPVAEHYGRVVPLDVKTVAAYQQLATEATHKVILRGIVTIELGKHRLRVAADVFSPKSTSYDLENCTIVIVEEI